MSKLALATQGQAAVTCEVSIRILPGRFAVEQLQVEERFVEPPLEVQPRIEEETRLLRETFATVTPERLWQGRFRAPLAGVKGSGNFGRRRVLNGQPRAPHTGEDYSADPGTPVVAAQRGRVVVARELYFAGNAVVLDHGLGLFTFYGHLSAISVKEGDVVAADAEIGKVGATGRVTGPHLHWAARLGAARVRPADLLSLSFP